MKLHEVEVVGRERFGEHILLRYRWDGPAPEPGQFVMVRPSARGLDPFLPRPLFAHDHEDGVTSLLFVVWGRGTALLAKDDDRFLVSPPLGRGFVTNGDGPVALLGGGVWVSPLKLLGRRLADSGVSYDVYLEVPDSAHEDYSSLLSGRYPGATLVSTREDENAPQVVLDRLGALGRYSGLYASGDAGMLEAVKRAAGGTVHAQLAVRERMACASGSCYGCAVPVWESGEKGYARACVEGPVFAAETLAW